LLKPGRRGRGVKAAASGGGKPPLPAKSGAPASSKVPEATAGAGDSKSTKVVPPAGGVAEAAKAAQALPLSGKRVADFATNISVDDYLGGKSLASLFLYIYIYIYIYNLFVGRVRRPGNESVESGHPACQTLDVPGGLRRRHVYDGLDLGWVGLDAAV
jgi:hypothetical protein